MNARIVRQVTSVFLLVSSVAALNAAWLLFAKHAYEAEIHSSSFYPFYVELRDRLLNPVTSTILIVLFSLWCFAVWRRWRQRPFLEKQELVVLAMVLAMIDGLILTACFRL
jgi:hypothetical protein